jgi:hypothetical protein
MYLLHEKFPVLTETALTLTTSVSVCVGVGVVIAGISSRTKRMGPV